MGPKDINIVLQIIEEQKMEWYNGPETKRMRGLCFEVMSYKKWAIDEIDRWVRIHYKDHGLKCLWDFKNMVNEYESKARDIDSPFMFALAADVCQGVIDTILAAGWVD